MLRKEKHTIECPCDLKKQFPIILQYDDEQPTGSKTQEVECPFCKTLLVIELPGTIAPTEQIFRGSKKG